MRSRSTRARHGYALVILLATALVLLLVVGGLAQIATLEMSTERRATLATRAAELAYGAKAWSVVHGDQLAVGETRTLDMRAALPSYMDAEVTVVCESRTPDGERFACRITLTRGTMRLSRPFSWLLRSSDTAN